jgi:hypothetical protein
MSMAITYYTNNDRSTLITVVQISAPNFPVTIRAIGLKKGATLLKKSFTNKVAPFFFFLHALQKDEV